MSTYHILGLKKAPRVRLFAYIKVVHELGLERRETVRSLSTVGFGELRDTLPSTKGPKERYLWCIGCDAHRSAK